MTITNNSIEQINAALLGMEHKGNWGLESSGLLQTIPQIEINTEKAELPDFKAAGDLNDWGWMKYRNLGICYGRFNKTLTQNSEEGGGLVMWYTPWDYFYYPWTYKNIPTVYFIPQSISLTGGVSLSGSSLLDIAPQKTGYKISTGSYYDSTSGRQLGIVNYYAIFIGQI